MAQGMRHAGLRVAIVILVALLNPFEINQWSIQRGETMWQRLHADHYDPVSATKDPLAIVPPPTQTVRPDGTAHGRDATTIVYFDDASVKANGDTRPLSAYVLIDLIDDIRSAPREAGPPRAIFIDMLLNYSAAPGQSSAEILSSLDDPKDAAACASRAKDGSPFRCLVRSVADITHYAEWKDRPECRDNTLARLACIRTAHGMPILFADPSAETATSSPALEALDAVSATVAVAVEEGAYPLALPATEAERAGRSFHLSPAAALYALWCSSGQGRCGNKSPIAEDRLKRPVWSSAYDHPVAVAWGVGGRSWFTDFLDAHRGGELPQYCAPADSSLWGTAKSFGALVASGLHPARRARCPYADAIPYDLLQKSLTSGETASLFSDKLVMIGGAFADSNDVVKAAPFTNVPGVYYHAMALDNLIEKGSNYPRPPEPITGSLDINWDDPLGWLLMFVAVSVIAMTREAMRRMPSTAYKRPDPHGDPALHFAALPMAPAWRAMGRRLIVGAAVAGALFVLLFGVTSTISLVPRTADFVALTLLCLLGACELASEVVTPLFDWFAHHLSPKRLRHVVFAPMPPPVSAPITIIPSTEGSV